MSMNESVVDFRSLLLDSYKKLNLSEEEAMVILMIEQLLREDNQLVTADLLSLKMNFSRSQIDAIMVKLVDRGLLKYEMVWNGMRTSLEGCRAKLLELFELNVAKSKAALNDEKRQATLSRLYGYFEKRLSRALSPIEMDSISTWLNDNYDEKAIQNALEDVLASKGRKSIKSVDKVLRSSRAREDIKKEGYSGVNETWDKDIDHTIEIAKLRWVKDDDED